MSFCPTQKKTSWETSTKQIHGQPQAEVVLISGAEGLDAALQNCLASWRRMLGPPGFSNTKPWYPTTPPKTNIDTQNGLEKITPLKNGNFWYLC